LFPVPSLINHIGLKERLPKGLKENILEYCLQIIQGQIVRAMLWSID